MKDIYEERRVTEARIPTDTDSCSIPQPHGLTDPVSVPLYRHWKRESEAYRRDWWRESARWGPGRSLDPPNAIGKAASEEKRYSSFNSLNNLESQITVNYLQDDTYNVYQELLICLFQQVLEAGLDICI